MVTVSPHPIRHESKSHKSVSRIIEQRGQTRQPTREAMIGKLADNFYINESSFFVTQHNTDLLCFGSDTDPARQASLDQKIDRAIHYATRFKDVKALDALRHIPKQKIALGGHESTTDAKPADPYLTLGLYLYLADECSRLGRKKTFLTAMREADAERSDDYPQSSKTLFHKTLRALRILHLDDSKPHLDEKHDQIIQEWCNNGTYTINGERNEVGTDGKLHGTYARLALDIALRQKLLGMNLPISYALGRRPLIEGKTQEEVLQATKVLVDPVNKDQTSIEIDNCIKSGHDLRRQRIRDLVHKHVPKHSMPMATPIVAKKILSLLPDASLEIMYRTGYSIAYAGDENLRHIYPKVNITGVTNGDSEMARISVGSVQPRHRTIFTCDGLALKDEKDETVLHESVANTLKHESMHMLVGYLSQEQKQKLKNAVVTVHDELAKKPELPSYFYQPIKTMDNRTIAQKIDYDATMYSGYVQKDDKGEIVRNASGEPVSDTRWEEVICNSYSMMHSKSMSPPIQNPFTYPKKGLESLQHLAEVINQSVALALEEARKEYPCDRERPIARGQ